MISKIRLFMTVYHLHDCRLVDFIKVLIMEVCYFLFYLESIQRIGDMKNGYDQVIKYHACSRIKYLRAMILHVLHHFFAIY